MGVLDRNRSFLSSIWTGHWKHIRDPDSAIYPVALGLPLISSNRDVLKAVLVKPQCFGCLGILRFL